MAIQIFGNSKSFDTKKAERWFAERRIPVQMVNLKDKGISNGELDSVISCLAKTCGSRMDAIEGRDPSSLLCPCWGEKMVYTKKTGSLSRR